MENLEYKLIRYKPSMVGIGWLVEGRHFKAGFVFNFDVIDMRENK